MKIKTNVTKVGNPKDYINKPITNAEHETIGEIIECEECKNSYELAIEIDITKLNVNELINNQSMSFEITGRSKNE